MTSIQRGRTRVGITLRVAVLAAVVFSGLIAVMATFTRVELRLMTESSLIARGGALLGALQEAAAGMPAADFLRTHADHVVTTPQTALERAALSTREVQDELSVGHRYTVIRPIALTTADGNAMPVALRVVIDG